MRSHARVLGHPAHPMLVMLPTAAFILLLLFDVVQWFTAQEAFWTVGLWVALVGFLGTLAAIVPGLIDMRHVPDDARAHKVVAIHFAVGMTLLAAYAGAVAIRWFAGPELLLWAGAIDLVGAGLVSVQGYLGGELVYKHHLGVPTESEGAEPTPFEHPDAQRQRTRHREAGP